MGDKILEFGQRLRREGVVGLFYFAGHGVQVNGKNYLIPIGVNIRHEKQVEFDGVDVGRVLAEMEDARNPTNIVILDACRDSPFPRSFRSNVQGLASIDAPKGTFIAYATAPGRTAADGDGDNGLYSAELIKWIQEPGLKIEDVFKRVRVSVMEKSNDQQTPWESSSLVGDFYFNPSVSSLRIQPPKAPSVPLTEVKFPDESWWVNNAPKIVSILVVIVVLVSLSIYLLARRHLNRRRVIPVALGIILLIFILILIWREAKPPTSSFEIPPDQFMKPPEFEVKIPVTPRTYQKITEVQAISTIDLGQYYALIIGNKKYDYWQRLKTPENDAIEVENVLREKYGFKTKVLRNATRHEILEALNDLQEELTEKDNLLIYYAGHGYLDKKIDRGYWVPVDGKLNNPSNWISTIDISDFLGRMSARHVLVVADSSYFGALTRSDYPQLKAGVSEEARNHWLKTMSEKSSRTVLSSGDLTPVLDTGGVGSSEHSVFTKAFLDVLRENNEILEGQKLYTQIAAQVAYTASLEQEQIPQYLPIRSAGHESGDFLFVPKQSAVAPSEQTAEGKETEKKEEQLSEVPDEEKAEKEEQAPEPPMKKEKKLSPKQNRQGAKKEKQPPEVPSNVEESPSPEWGIKGGSEWKIRK